MESQASGVVFESVITKAIHHTFFTFLSSVLFSFTNKFIYRIKAQALKLKKIKFLFIRKFNKCKIYSSSTSSTYIMGAHINFSKDFGQNDEILDIMLNILYSEK